MEMSGQESLAPQHDTEQHAIGFADFLDAVLDGTTDRTVYDLSLLIASPAANDAGLDALSSGEEIAIPEVTIDDVVRERATVSTHAVAIIDGRDGSGLTFDAFDRRVNALAETLVSRGVRVGDRVAVVLPRSVDLVVSLAAVLRAGAAYVPVDPEYPSERVAAILEDSAASAMVTGSSASSPFGDPGSATGLPAVVLDDAIVRERLDAGAAEPPVLSRALTPGDVAAVIFTSGTTGRPKGVELSHRALTSRLAWGREVLGLRPGHVALWKSGPGFVDASTELFGPLTGGAAVVVVSDEDARDPGRLTGLIARHEVTHLLTVPGLADAIVGLPDAKDLLVSLQSWVLSGEALTAPTVDVIRQVAPDVIAWNFYGSTEIAGDATVAVVTGPRAVVVPIGGPVANTFVRVL
ncbi:MAG: AMP-binding protein, partial [Microbacterium sp.]